MSISDKLPGLNNSGFSTQLGTPMGSTTNASYFSSLMSGGGGDLASANMEARAVAERAQRLSLESSRELILSRVIDQKNAMTLESRGSSAKKATEIAKEIGF